MWTDNDAKRRGSMKKLIVLCLFSTLFAIPVSAQSDWATFWAKFKPAVVKGDKATVLKLSQSTELPGRYQRLFGSPAKQQCFAKAKPVKDEQGGYIVFCGNTGYYFSKVGGQFKFTESFAND
jgi:hypothetical protein